MPTGPSLVALRRNETLRGSGSAFPLLATSTPRSPMWQDHVKRKRRPTGSSLTATLHRLIGSRRAVAPRSIPFRVYRNPRFCGNLIPHASTWSALLRLHQPARHLGRARCHARRDPLHHRQAVWPFSHGRLAPPHELLGCRRGRSPAGREGGESAHHRSRPSYS